jgi:cell pole-organizing protein PopZ
LTSAHATTGFARWSVPANVDLREWDEEFVVRVDSTGATYVLSSIAGETIKAIRAGAVSMADIAARVLATFDPPSAATQALTARFSDRDAPTHDVLDALRELESLGVVRAESA